jgi:acetyl-CoA acetyltransferase
MGDPGESAESSADIARADLTAKERRMSDRVYIIGIGMTKFGKYLDRTIKDLTAEALERVLSDAGLSREDIEAAWFGNSYWGMYTMQHGVRGQVALSANGLDGIPVTNLENACAGGSSALHGAWTGVKAGLYDCVLALGAEKIYDEDRGKMMLSFATGSTSCSAACQQRAERLIGRGPVPLGSPDRPEGVVFETFADRAGEAAATMGRFGS